MQTRGKKRKIKKKLAKQRKNLLKMLKLFSSMNTLFEKV